MRLSRAIKEKRPKTETRQDLLILQDDLARPHVAKVVKKYLETLKWEVIPQPPYSPDIVPSDYWLFQHMQNDLAGHQFTSLAEIKNWLNSWITLKEKSFFEKGIQKLCERLGNIIANDGQYFE